MDIDAIQHVCVIGAGTMGSQIALQCATSGYHTVLTDADAAALERGMTSNRTLLQQRVAKGRITQEKADATLNLLTTAASLADAAHSADFVIEAIYENLDAKRAIFTELNAICSPSAILASNSSSIVISKIATGTVTDPSRTVNFHFFHPATVMRLVEVGKGPDTSEATAQLAMEFGRRIGKEPVLVNKEIFGFIVNYALTGLSKAAMQLYEGGYASIEDIDKALKLGLNHPMGPFELADFSGVDITYNAMLARYNETGDPEDKPPAFLEQMVAEGKLGRKTGHGFYQYPAKPKE